MKKIATKNEINLNILDATATSNEAFEAEIFKQAEIETEVKSLMKCHQKWITEQTSGVDKKSSLGSNHRDNIRLPRIELPF